MYQPQAYGAFSLIERGRVFDINIDSPDSESHLKSQIVNSSLPTTFEMYNTTILPSYMCISVVPQLVTWIERTP